MEFTPCNTGRSFVVGAVIAAVVVVIAGVTTSSVNAVNIVIIVGIALHGVVTGLTIFVVVVDVVVNVVATVVVGGCGVIAVVVDCLLNKSRNKTFQFLLKPQLSSCQIFKEIPKMKRNDFEDFCFKSFQRRRKFLGLSWRRFFRISEKFHPFFQLLVANKPLAQWSRCRFYL